MELSRVTVHVVNGSYYAYIPKAWAREVDLKKGDKVSWSIWGEDHDLLILKKMGINEVELLAKLRKLRRMQEADLL